MSADRFKSVWESLVSILLDGNTEAAFSAELVTARTAGTWWFPPSERLESTKLARVDEVLRSDSRLGTVSQSFNAR
jgi:hypothetical protein